MYRENFKTELPQFSDKQVLISELGAVSGTFSDEAGRQNAKIINRAIRELSEHGGGTLVIPAGIWASAPIRLLKSCAASSGKPGSFKIYQEQGRLSVSHHKL